MNKKLLQAFKTKIQAGPVFGAFSKASDPGIIEVMGHGGFDFVIIDLEHGPNTIETVQNLIRAAEISGILPLIRVPEDNDEMIGKSLDVGAYGVQVPQITDPDTVNRVIKTARFYPEGARGLCRYVRAGGYSSMDKNDYFREANKSIIVIQLEGKAALDNLDEILEVEGFDIVFVGPYDLSQSLGVPGEIEHPTVISTIREIVAACLAKGISVGTFTDTPKQAAMWTDQGIKYIANAVDMGIFYNAVSELVSELKSGAG